MPEFKVEFDVNKLASEFQDLKNKIEEAAKVAMASLAASTHAQAHKFAEEKLGTGATRNIYAESLSFEPLSDNLWVVSLDMKKAGWIEDGRKCVIYGKNRLDQPKVLTPDGPVKITDIKIGMMVLNQFGKWTTVEEVYNEHIVQKSKMQFIKIEKCNYTPDNKRLHKRINAIFLAQCPVCNHQVKYFKIKKDYFKKGIFCQKCLSKERIVTIETPNKFSNKKHKNRNKIILTGDHKIMTQRGWVEAWDLQKTDSISVPSWSKCKTCDKSVFMGNDFCYSNNDSRCSSSYYANKTLKEGRHQSQRPDSGAKYLKRMQILQKINKTELEFEKKAIEFGHKVVAYDRNLNIDDYDIIREFPVKVKSDGAYSNKYYFIDFFVPKLNLGFEIDGKSFHCEIRDSVRDKKIKETLKCDIIRIPAKNVWKKDFFKTNVEPILKNHSNEIDYLPFSNYKIKKTYLKANSSICHRWDITVKDGESFVCNGFLIHNSGFMEELLKGKSAKTAKDGSRYAVIPFEHSKVPSMQTPSAQRFTQEIRSFLKEKKINYKKIEYNLDGSPKLGLLHSFKEGIGKEIYPSSKAKNDVFKGLSIYQSQDKKTGKVTRDVMTFRIISDKHRSEGLWNHPGRAGVFIIEKTYEWALSKLETEIIPEILQSIDRN